MYFYDIDRAKAQLTGGPVAGHTLLPYLLAHELMFLALLQLSSQYNFGPSSSVMFACEVLLVTIGIWYLYWRNGGASGMLLAERYLVLGWVVGVRVACACIVLGIGSSLVESWIVPATTAPARWWLWAQTAMGWSIPLIYYWRTGVHLREVRQRQAPTPAVPVTTLT